MAKRSVPRARRPASRKAVTVIPPIPAPKLTQQQRALYAVIRDGGRARPYNRLVCRDPAETVQNCRRIVDWLARPNSFGKPTTDDLLADHYVHKLVGDALHSVEQTLAGLWGDRQRVEYGSNGREP